MTLKFEGETLNIGGFEITGTVLVEARVTDASFDHAFGTEHLSEIEFTPDGFSPDAEPKFKLVDSLVARAISDWVDSHETQLYRAFKR